MLISFLLLWNFFLFLKIKIKQSKKMPLHFINFGNVTCKMYVFCMKLCRHGYDVTALKFFSVRLFPVNQKYTSVTTLCNITCTSPHSSWHHGSWSLWRCAQHLVKSKLTCTTMWLFPVQYFSSIFKKIWKASIKSLR